MKTHNKRETMDANSPKDMKMGDLLAYASLANVSFAYTWAALLNRQQDFYRKVPPSRNLILATVCVAILTIGILATRWLVARHPKADSWLWWLPWSPLLIPVNHFCGQVARALPALAIVINAVPMGVVVLVGIGSAWGFRPRIEKTCRTAVLLISPLLLLTLSEAFVLPVIAPRRPIVSVAPKDGTLTGSPGRFVLILFDELDQLKTFDERPDSLQLRHFDEFRDQAVYADHAYSPETETLLSVLSYLLGRNLSRVDPKGFNEAIATDAETQEKFDVRTKPTLFSRAAALGSRTAVVGWHLPYCRIVSGPVFCSWELGNVPGPEQDLSSTAYMSLQFGNAALDLPLLEKLGLLTWAQFQLRLGTRTSHIAAYESILTAAKSHIAKPSLDFVYLHVPVPHDPVIFDRQTEALTFKQTTDYSANLALADKALGEMMSALKSADMWMKTNVLVVGDHGLRDRPKGEEGVDRRRVPFMLKLAGQTRRVDVHMEFGALVLHDLVLMLLQKQDVPVSEVLEWLMQHSQRPKPAPGREE